MRDVMWKIGFKFGAVCRRRGSKGSGIAGFREGCGARETERKKDGEGGRAKREGKGDAKSARSRREESHRVTMPFSSRWTERIASKRETAAFLGGRTRPG